MTTTLKKFIAPLVLGLAVIAGGNVAVADTGTLNAPAITRSNDVLEIAQARLPRLDTVIDAHCEGETAVFRIFNRGAKWPKMGLVQIVGPDGRKVLVKRKMRFAKNQSATMRYKKAGNYPDGVSLYIDPIWDAAAPSTEKHLRCS